MKRRQPMTQREEQYRSSQLQTSEKAERLSSSSNTIEIQNTVEEIQTGASSMESKRRIMVQRTVMTPRGRVFPRKPMTFDLGEQTTGELFSSLQEHVTAGFPGLRGQFILLHKGVEGKFIPCENEKDLLKLLDEINDGPVQLFVQDKGMRKWQRRQEETSVMCTFCHGNLNGMRLSCLECDYHLCTQCDENGCHDNHVMVRCDRPRFFIFALPMFTEALPQMCKEVKEKNSGAKLPRLGPKEVRQYWQAYRKERDMAEGNEKDVARRTSRCCSKAVSCSNCNELVEGMRLKCLECEDFSLCGPCDEKAVHVNHVMVKCDRPRFFIFALPMFSEVLPKLCKEMKERNSDTNLPRLGANEVRQFWKAHRNEQDMTEEQGTKRKCRRQHGGEWKRGTCPYSTILCNNCNILIDGVRLKCLECEDFSLCSGCDEKDVHANHVMVKSDRPRFFMFPMKKIAEILPKLCEEQRKLYPDGPIPRMEREQVFQFWKQSKKGTDEANGEHRMKCFEKRQHLKDMWQKFLSNIAIQDSENDDWEMVSEAEQAVTEKEMDVDMKTTKVQQESENKTNDTNVEVMEDLQILKRQWMQKCAQQWREHLHGAHWEGTAKQKMHPFRVWGPYMRGCWVQWRKQMDEAGIKMHQTHKKTDIDAGSSVHPRRQWIQNSWRMWRQQAAEKHQQWVSEGVTNSSDQSQTAKCRGPLPGYHFLMNQSWKMMIDIHQYERKGEKQSPFVTHSKIDVDENIIPLCVAKNILKKCWMDGCRQLWWMQTKKQLNVDDDPESEKVGQITQNDIMEVMSTRPVWRTYMQQSWKLWNQLSKKVGLIAGQQPDASVQTEMIDESHKSQKQDWMNECWLEWVDKMPNGRAQPEENTSETEKPRWEKRPFPGWHQLMITSWQKMKIINNEETKASQSQLLKRAWMKEIQSEMKKLSLQKKPVEDQDVHSHVEDTSKSAKPATDCPKDDGHQWAKFGELQNNLITQYWQMWRMKKQQEAGDMTGCFPKHLKHWRQQKLAMRQSGEGDSEDKDENDKMDAICYSENAPRLRVTLRMRDQSSE